MLFFIIWRLFGVATSSFSSFSGQNYIKITKQRQKAMKILLDDLYFVTIITDCTDIRLVLRVHFQPYDLYLGHGILDNLELETPDGDHFVEFWETLIFMQYQSANRHIGFALG